MNANGRVVVLDSAGTSLAPSSSYSWAPPRDKNSGQRAEYFGWLGPDGFSTVRIDDVMAVFPNPQRREMYILMLHYQVNMAINYEDALRLMKRLGWMEPSNTPRV